MDRSRNGHSRKSDPNQTTKNKTRKKLIPQISWFTKFCTKAPLSEIILQVYGTELEPQLVFLCTKKKTELSLKRLRVFAGFGFGLWLAQRGPNRPRPNLFPSANRPRQVFSTRQEEEEVEKDEEEE